MSLRNFISKEKKNISMSNLLSSNIMPNTLDTYSPSGNTNLLQKRLLALIENCFKSGTSKELQTYIEQAKILKLDVSGILPLTNDPTLLHLAVEGGLVSLVQVVLSMENRPNLDIKDGLGWTALHIACRNHNVPITWLLLQAGANPNVVNTQNTTPLHYLVRSSEKSMKSRKSSFKNLKEYFSKDIQITYPELIELLIDKGIDVDAKNSHDETPLMHAARSGNEEALKVLLKRNANRSIVNKGGQTASILAQENGHSSIVALLAREEKPSHLQEVKKPEKKKINIWRRKSFSENEIPELEVTPVNGIHTNWLRIKVCYSEDDNDLELISLVNPDWTIDEWRNKVLKKIPNTDKELFFWHIKKNWLEPEEKVLTYVDLLTETPTVRLKEKVIKILSIQRPTDLKRSSSIGEGIYGRDLDFLWDKEQEIIPVVELLLESLLTKELGSIPLPLQRCSASIVFELKRQLDSGFVLNFSQIPGVNVYTLLYDFFAEMSTPLIPPDLAYQFLYAAATNSEIEIFKTIVKSLPKINGAILFRIIGALLKLKPPQNTMLLSIQWGTVLLKSVENEAALQDCTFRCKNLNYLKSTVLELFFQNFDLIF